MKGTIMPYRENAKPEFLPEVPFGELGYYGRMRKILEVLEDAYVMSNCTQCTPRDDILTAIAKVEKVLRRHKANETHRTKGWKYVIEP